MTSVTYNYHDNTASSDGILKVMYFLKLILVPLSGLSSSTSVTYNYHDNTA